MGGGKGLVGGGKGGNTGHHSRLRRVGHDEGGWGRYSAAAGKGPPYVPRRHCSAAPLWCRRATPDEPPPAWPPQVPAETATAAMVMKPVITMIRAVTGASELPWRRYQQRRGQRWRASPPDDRPADRVQLSRVKLAAAAIVMKPRYRKMPIVRLAADAVQAASFGFKRCDIHALSRAVLTGVLATKSRAGGGAASSSAAPTRPK